MRHRYALAEKETLYSTFHYVAIQKCTLLRFPLHDKHYLEQFQSYLSYFATLHQSRPFFVFCTNQAQKLARTTLYCVTKPIASKQNKRNALVLQISCSFALCGCDHRLQRHEIHHPNFPYLANQSEVFYLLQKTMRLGTKKYQNANFHTKILLDSSFSQNFQTQTAKSQSQFRCYWLSVPCNKIMST